MNVVLHLEAGCKGNNFFFPHKFFSGKINYFLFPGQNQTAGSGTMVSTSSPPEMISEYSMYPLSSFCPFRVTSWIYLLSALKPLAVIFSVPPGTFSSASSNTGAPNQKRVEAGSGS